MTGKQTEFIKWYCSGDTRNNGTQSAIKAGYSTKGADVRAVELLGNSSIVEAIKAYRAKMDTVLVHDRQIAIDLLHKALDIAIEQRNPTAITGAIRELNAISNLHNQTITTETIQTQTDIEPELGKALADEYKRKASELGIKVG